MFKKLTIEQMQALAQAKNGVCLSKKYIDSKTKLRWQCRGTSMEGFAEPYQGRQLVPEVQWKRSRHN